MASIEGAPAAVIRAADHVRDKGVGVQVRVGGAAGSVTEGGGDEPVGGDLLGAVVSSTRDSGVAFEVAECGVDGRVVCCGALGGQFR